MRFDYCSLTSSYIFTVGTTYSLWVFALYFFTIGIRGLLTKKPFFISYIWPVGICIVSGISMILRFIFVAIFSYPNYLNRGFWRFSSFFWLQLAMVMISLAIIYFALPGYLGYGITHSLFRENLIDVLEGLGMPFEENSSGIYLYSIGANLRVVLPPEQGGLVRVNIRPRKFNGVLRNIVKGMNSYYQTEDVSAILYPYYFYLFLGILMIIFIALD